MLKSLGEFPGSPVVRTLHSHYSNLDSIFKSRDISLPTKVRLVKAMVFPVVIYRCGSWTVKKAERPRIDAFELWYWRRLLRVPWTARRSNQSILKEVSPGCSLEGMMLKLKLRYFGHLMWRVDSLEKTDARRDWGQEEKGMTEDEMAGWHHRLDGPESEWTLGVAMDREAWRAAKSQTRLSDWTESLIGKLKFHKPLGAAKQNKIKGKNLLFWPRKVLTLSGRCQIWSNDQNDVSDKKTNFSNHKQTGFETLFSKYHLSSLLEEACGKLPLLCSASSNSVIFQFICLGLQIMVFTYLHSE